MRAHTTASLTLSSALANRVVLQLPPLPPAAGRSRSAADEGFAGALRGLLTGSWLATPKLHWQG